MRYPLNAAEQVSQRRCGAFASRLDMPKRLKYSANVHDARINRRKSVPNRRSRNGMRLCNAAS